jgi:hypothetical protein
MGCILLPLDPGRRSRVTAVTRSLALGYFIGPLQGQNPLPVWHYNTPPDLWLKVSSQKGEFTNADFVQEAFLRTPGAAEMRSCVGNYRRPDQPQVILSAVPLCR